jgi:hypothetical protein
MRFVIIAMPRTGSSHLVSMLGRHPEITCHGEVFHKSKVFLRGKGAKDEGRLAELARMRTKDWQSFLEAIFTISQGRPHCGFKIFKGHHREALTHVIADRSIAKIVLIRTNVLANFSSAMMARQTGHYGPRSEDSHTVQFEDALFDRFSRHYTEYYQTALERLKKSDQTFLQIRYEEINHLKTWENLQGLLGAALEPAAREIRAPRKLDVLSRFSNPDQVMRFLEARKLSHWAVERERLEGPLAETGIDPFG